MGEDVSLAGENHGMHASPFAWRDTVEQRSAMAGQAQVDSGRELHGGEVERAVEALGEDLGEAAAGTSCTASGRRPGSCASGLRTRRWRPPRRDGAAGRHASRGPCRTRSPARPTVCASSRWWRRPPRWSRGSSARRRRASWRCCCRRSCRDHWPHRSWCTTRRKLWPRPVPRRAGRTRRSRRGGCRRSGSTPAAPWSCSFTFPRPGRWPRAGCRPGRPCASWVSWPGSCSIWSAGAGSCQAWPTRASGRERSPRRCLLPAVPSRPARPSRAGARRRCWVAPLTPWPTRLPGALLAAWPPLSAPGPGSRRPGRPCRRGAAVGQRPPTWRSRHGWRPSPAKTGGSMPTPRTWFRLVEPPEDQPKRRWRLEFLLQATDEPSLLVPAAEVWRAAGTLSVLARRVEQPQELLLTDLGRAIRLYPELERALRSARPAALALDAAGAHRFLRDAAPLLAQTGFGVLLPSWWDRRGARVGLRLVAGSAAAPGAVAKPGGLNLDTLVDYRWELALGDERLTAEELEELARLKVPLVRLRGRWVELDPDRLARGLAFLEQHADGAMPAADALAAGLGLVEGPVPDLPVAGIDATGWLGDLLSGQADRRLGPMRTPTGFRGELRPYQERGLAWLAFLGGLG